MSRKIEVETGSRMDTPQPPSGDSRAYRQLAVTHELYIRRLSGILLERVPLQAGDPIGKWVPYVLYHHIFQLSRATSSLVKLGYSEETLPLGRALISSTMNIMFIVRSDNPEGWALRFWLQLGELEQRMLARERRIERFDPAVIERIASEAAEAAQGAIAAHIGEGGIYPDKLLPPRAKKPNLSTWHGLSDRGLAISLGLLDWYETEYDYLSTVTHAQSIAVHASGQAIMRGETLVCGPHFRAPLLALTSSISAIKYSSLAIMKHYDLSGADSAFQALNNSMTEAINQYREESGGNEGVRAVFGRLPDQHET
jgi:hypothetical protein